MKYDKWWEGDMREPLKKYKIGKYGFNRTKEILIQKIFAKKKHQLGTS